MFHFRQINAPTFRKFKNNMAARKQSFQLSKISLITMSFHCRQIIASTVRKFRNNTSFEKDQPNHYVFPLQTNNSDYHS